MHTNLRRCSVAFLIAAVGCGDGTDAGGSSSDSGSSFTATVNGTAWAAEPVGVRVTGGGLPGGVVISGSRTTGGIVTSLTIILNSITGPGTYALGVGLGVYGGSASVGESTGNTGAANHWATALNGVAGQIVITTFSASRIVATFRYETVADTKTTAAGTRTVTDGKINLPVTVTILPVPDKIGAKLSAVLGGKPYNAWAVSADLRDFTGGAGVSINSHSSENRLNLSLVGVTTPGSYAISNSAPQRTIVAGTNGGDAAHCCWGQNAGGDVGTTIITSVTATRVKGTFSGTIQPQPGKPATAPLVITDGAFDIGVN